MENHFINAQVRTVWWLSPLYIVALVASIASAGPTQAAGCSPKDVWQVNDCTGVTCCDVGYVCRAQNFKNGSEGTLPQHICEVVPPAEEEGGSLANTPLQFTPQVTIPGSLTIGGKQFTVQQGKGITVTGDTVAQYLSIFYKFFIALLAVAAVVMAMWGGFKRIMAAGSPEKIADANDSVISAITGLILALVSYSLLNLINPQLVSFKTLAIKPVTRIEFQALEPDLPLPAATQPATPPALAVISGQNISNPDNKVATPDLITSLRTAALGLLQQNVYVIVTSGTRTEAEQRALILQNCQNPPGSATCNPKPGKVETCPMPNGPLSCPHTSGSAVDLWAASNGSVPISQADCIQDRVACEQNVAMAALITAMHQAGFCKLDSEPWHFEKPVVSVGRCH